MGYSAKLHNLKIEKKFRSDIDKQSLICYNYMKNKTNIHEVTQKLTKANREIDRTI